MTLNRRLRASKLLPLLVVMGLGQPLGACNSGDPEPSGSPNASTGGSSNTRAGAGGTVASSTGAGGAIWVGNGGSGIAGQSRNSGGVSSSNGGGANTSAATGGLVGGGATNGGAAITGSANGGTPNGAAPSGGTANGGTSTGGVAHAGTTSTVAGGLGAGGVGTGSSTGGAGVGSAATGGTSSATAGAVGTSPLQGLPTASSVLEAMQRANSYFVGRWPDPTKDIETDKTRPSNLWTRAIYYEGLMGLYSVEPDLAKKTTYYDYAVTWASTPAHPYAMTYMTATTLTNNADNQACGQTYIDLYRIDPQSQRIAIIKANIDDMIAKNTINVWTWIDAIQMAMPVFAKLGKTLGDTRYFDAMWSLYAYSRNTQGGGLFNTAEGLWWRDYHYTPGGGTKQVMTSSLNNSMPATGTDAYIVAPNGRNLYWSRGNGWVIAALVRVLDELPTTDSHRPQYISDFKAMAQALLPIQRSDGFWTESLVDPTHCATIGVPNQDGPETSGTALFAYGLAWGIRNGHLDAATFGPALVGAWSGLATKALQSNGLLGYVQNTGDRPCTGPTPLAATTLANFDDYGVGCFLLAGTEVYRLTSN